MHKQKLLVFWCLMVWGFSLGAEAGDWSRPVDARGQTCNRTLTFASFSARLNTEQRALLNRGQLASFTERDRQGFIRTYVGQLTGFDPLLIMGVYSSYNEQARRLGDFLLRSRILTEQRNVATVELEQSVDFGVFFGGNTEYRVRDTITRRSGGYNMDVKLIASTTAAFSPRWADAYLRALPQGSGTFVLACNYMVPRQNTMQGQYNSNSISRMRTVATRLMSWLASVNSNAGAAERYRNRIRGMNLEPEL